MEIKTNEIKDIYKGHYFMLLDFPTIDILNYMLDKSYQYVWGVNYEKHGCKWEKDSCKLFEKEWDGLYTRNVNMEFLMNTSDFMERLPYIQDNLHIMQINKMPPYYLNLNRIKGKTRYDLLKTETDYLFEVKLPFSSISSDYTEIVSPNLDFLIGIKEKLSLSDK